MRLHTPLALGKVDPGPQSPATPLDILTVARDADVATGSALPSA